MSGLKAALDKRGITAISKRGQLYIRLPNETGGKLKAGTIDNPSTYSRAEEGDRFVVRKEGLSGNMWAEYFPTAEEAADFIEEKRA